jgi:preprotein translocase subunit YajC
MQPGAASPLASLIPVLAIFAIFYFLLIRPQQKKQQELEAMLKALKKGDRVLTSGGVYGVITALRGQDLEMKVSENVRVVVSRSFISRLAPETSDEKTPVAVGA